MTRKEAIRLNDQAARLMELGFTQAEAEQLRRISMTLHRWHEGECGTDHACIVRGHWDREKQELIYDDNGRPYWEQSGGTGRSRYQPIAADREKGARKRLQGIIDARNRREVCADGDDCPDAAHHTRRPLSAYIQTDPRGAALYIIRPGDVPDGKDVCSYYDRGVCVY